MTKSRTTNAYQKNRLLQARHSVASDRRVGELGGQQLQWVLHIHRPPLPQQLQSLLGLLGQIPVHTLEELCQGLQREEEKKEEDVSYLRGLRSVCLRWRSTEISCHMSYPTHLLLCGEVVSELPHQVLFFGAQLLGWRVAHDDLLVHYRRTQKSNKHPSVSNRRQIRALRTERSGSMTGQAA